MLKESSLIKAQDFLIQGLEAEYKALKAQKKPNVAMNAGLTAPARDTAEDSTANIGILVNYVFNDGGRLENQIATLKEQIKEAKQQLDFYHEMGGGSMFNPETGEMIDEATAKIALMRVSKAHLAGLVDKEYLDLMAEKSKSITGYDILAVSYTHLTLPTIYSV